MIGKALTENKKKLENENQTFLTEGIQTKGIHQKWFGQD